MAEKTENTVKVPKITPELKDEEYVEVFLFKDDRNYKNDVFVSCNGDNCVIKRGEPVMVKRKFAEILENSDKQKIAATKYKEQKRKEAILASQGL